MANKKWYAVARGKKPGVYTEWFGEHGAEVQIRGFNRARFKGFPTREAAAKWIEEINVKEPLQEKKKNTKNKGHDLDRIVIYTDGSSLNNPGPGGYGAVIVCRGARKEISDGYRLTTNNRMELMACVKALESIKKRSDIALHSDSRYVVDGITKGWAKKWRSRGWKKYNGENAINPDLWARLLDICAFHSVDFIWVKGHAGNPENERCDQLATRAAARKGLPVDEGYLSIKHR